jgi:hypothetical protein
LFLRLRSGGLICGCWVKELGLLHRAEGSSQHNDLRRRAWSSRSGRGVETEIKGEGGEENGDGIGIRLY